MSTPVPSGESIRLLALMNDVVRAPADALHAIRCAQQESCSTALRRALESLELQFMLQRHLPTLADLAMIGRVLFNEHDQTSKSVGFALLRALPPQHRSMPLDLPHTRW